MLEFALQYAGRGWRVLPLHSINSLGSCTCGRPDCSSPGKHPLTKRGFKDASVDPATIEAWWAKYPWANIGIATGQGLVVLDVDGPEGAAELKALVALRGPLDNTLTARTGNGFHIFYAASGIKSSARSKLHVRGDGGFVVAAPSRHASGRTYQWVNDSTVAKLQDHLRDWMLNGQKEREKDDSGVRRSGLPHYLQALPSRGLAERAIAAIKKVESTWSQEEENRIRRALTAIPASSYEIWFKIGMILQRLSWVKLDGSNTGLKIWDEWSQTCQEKYPGLDALKAKWATFGRSERPNGLGLGSLFAFAQDAGWIENNEQVHDSPQGMGETTEAPSQADDEELNGGQSDPVNETEANGHPFPFDEPVDSRGKKNQLIALNDKYAVIGDLGGKCMVMSWIPSKVDEHVKIPSFQSFKAFQERYANKYVVMARRGKDGERAEKIESLGACWLRWGRRKSYEGIDLMPGKPALLSNGYLNLWHGFAMAPAAGGWERMKWHILHVLAGGDVVSARYIVSFAAWAIQHPDERAEVALVFRGGKGSGKGTFANALVRIFGSHGLQIYSSKHLVGAFNGHLRSCLLLFADEAFWAGDKQGESVLKGMLTERTLVIEQKGVDATPWKNRLHVIMAANAEWVVPASHDERRYAMFDVSGARIGDRPYFEALHAEINAGGLGAMLHDLQQLRLGDFHPRQIIHTAALREQKERSLDPLHQWWEGVLQSGQLPGVANERGYIPASMVYDRAKVATPKLRDMSVQAFGRFLRAMGAEGLHRSTGEFWHFLQLAEMRKKWERKFSSWAWREDFREWLK